VLLKSDLDVKQTRLCLNNRYFIDNLRARHRAIEIYFR
jgi:hypothetical protein